MKNLTQHKKKRVFQYLVAAFLLLAGSGTAWGQNRVSIPWANGNTYGGNNYGIGGDVDIEVEGTVYMNAPIGVLDPRFKVTIKPASGYSTCTIKRASGYTGELFTVAAVGPYAAGHLVIAPGVTIDGNGSNVTVPDGGYLIHVAVGGVCDINGTSSSDRVTITNTKGEVAVFNQGTFNANYTYFTNNIAVNNNVGKNGGAVRNFANCTFHDCVFSGNQGGVGGAIFNISTITCFDCDFTSNIATNMNELGGGAIISDDNGTYVAVTGLARCNFTSNKAYNGGAIIAWGNLYCEDCVFTSNRAENPNNLAGPGGAIYYGGSARSDYLCALNGCTFDSNSSQFKGGALLVFKNHTTYSNCSIVNTDFYNNESMQGGAITVHSSGSVVTFYSGRIYNNRAVLVSQNPSGSGQGAGVHIDAGSTFNLEGGEIGISGTNGGNSAYYKGGGVYTAGTFNFNGGNIYYNQANNGSTSSPAGDGGGIYIADGDFYLNNGHSIIKNSAVNGGGIYINGGTINVNGTVGGSGTNKNTATNGGGIYVNGGGLYLNNGGLVSYNSATNGGGIFINGGETYLKNGGVVSNNQGTNGAGLYVNGGFSNFMQAGSSINNNTGATNGGGVYINGGMLQMQGGTINSQSATNGGGVYVNTNGQLYQTGGTIGGSGTENTATYGAGVYSAGGTSLSGGSISYNQTTNANGKGAGVYVAGGTTTQNGNHVIERNSVASEGAGVYINGGTFNMTADGGITNHYIRNHSATNGAGVYVNTNGTFNLSGGYVGQSGAANAATLGGGVYVNGGDFNMTGGNIINNTASQDGAGVYLASGSFDFENQGVLSYNTATRNGGGVYVAGSNATFNMKNSLLEHNTAVNGGGVYVNTRGTFTMLGEDLSHSCEVRLNTATSGNGAGVYQKGTTTLTGLIRIVGNTKGSAENNMYLDQTSSATLKYSQIGADGLLCGSNIGVNNIPNSKEITRGTGSAAVANAQYAYRNEFFHYDGVGQEVFPNTSIVFSPNSSSLYLVPTIAHNMYTLALTATAGTDYVGSAGNISRVNTLAGLAYLAYDVNKNGNDYTGKTVVLNGDIVLSSTDNWEPIGNRTECDPCPFKGTFDGQFHTISGLRSDFGYLDAGLFGYVVGGTIKNVLIASGSGCKASENLGGLVGYMYGGNIFNCEVRTTLTAGSGYITGGLVGRMENGAKIHSCCAMPTFSGSGSSAGLVGTIEGSGSKLFNSFVNTTTATASLVYTNGGVIQNCYVRGMGSLIYNGNNPDYCYSSTGSAAGSNGVFGTTSLVNGKYGYNQQDQQISGGSASYVTNGGLSNTGELGGLLATLNKWVGSSTTYARWTRTMASSINGDYPVLMFAGAKCLGSKDGTFIDYAAELNTMITAYNNATGGGSIYLYDVPSTVTVANGSNVKIYVNENIGFLQSVTLQNVRTGVTLDNSSTGFMSYDWHMFSSPLTNAPMGLTYASQVSSYPIYANYSAYLSSGIPESVFASASINPPATSFNTSANVGYFPTNTPYASFDYYCYSENYTHWINFKREGVPAFYDHWRQNEDANGMHQNIPYQNESNMLRGKGYMVAIDQTSMLMTDGSLDNNAVNATVSNTSSLSGFEAPLKGVNLIGNPYQAYLDFNQIGNGLNTYFILDADAHGYIAYVNGGSTPTESAVINTNAPRYLHPHQGFIVRVPQNASGVTFNNTMILAGNGTSAFRDESNHYPMVNLAVEDSRGRRDYTTVELDRPDLGGGEKIQGLHAGDASLWVHFDDADWQVAFTPVGTMSVPVRFEAYQDGTFTLYWEAYNGYFSYMHLIDNMTGADIDCLETDEYRFEATTHDYTSRFRLVFEYTGVDENEDDVQPETFAFIMGDELVVNGEGTLQLFDLNGRCLLTETLHDSQSTVSLPALTTGVYILRLTANQQTRTQKMVINQ